MGLFSSKKKTYVSSVVYNLAGDEDKRANYLKTTVIGAILAERPSLAQAINQSYIDGPGIKLRNYAKWAVDQGYADAIGWRTGSLHAGDSINQEVLKTFIPTEPGMEVSLQTAKIDAADFTYWADQYVTENYPDLIGTKYVVDMDEATNTITITWEDETTTSFQPVGFNKNAQYLYASYILVGGEEEGPVEVGTVVSLAPGEPFPSTSGWTQNSYNSENKTATLTTLTEVNITYSDSTPPESSSDSSSTDQNYTEFSGEWERTTYKGMKPGVEATYSLREVMSQNQVGNITQTVNTDTVVENIGGGVTKTTVTTVTQDVLSLVRTYKVDEQEILQKSWSSVKVFIYEENSGHPELDAMFDIPQDGGTFLPFIPIRINNRYVSELWPDTIYPFAKRAMRKSIGGKYDKIQQSINDNPSIGDIDYAYAVFGVSLNVKENASKKYVYKFFQAIMNDYNTSSGTAYAAWKAQWDLANESWEAWIAWRERQYSGDVGFGDPEPVRLPYPTMPTNRLNVSTSGMSVLNYNVTILWNYITEEIGTGVLAPDKKRGDLWFEIGATETFNQWMWVSSGGDSDNWQAVQGQTFVNDAVTLNWQVTDTTWRRMTIIGLRHNNLIYGGKSVNISAKEALQDVEESGFLIPLHRDVYRSMGLKDGTQMSQACCFLVFNCYQVVKQKWYQSGIFKIIVVIVVIVVSIYTGGAGASASAGLLGTNAAVGAALTGLAATSMTAIIVGAVANAIAAMILVTIIQKGATALFGEKIGAIVGAIAGFIALQAGTAYMNNQSMASAFSGMMKADNILKLTEAAGKGYVGYVQASVQEMAAESERVIAEYEKVSKEIQEKYASTIGYGLANSQEILNSVLEGGNEAQASFLQRTLMTGTDVAQMSFDLLTNFPEITTSTNLNLV